MPLELWIEAPEGIVRVKSARPGHGARLEGVPLGAGWVELEPGARLQVGAACLALELNAAHLSGEHRRPDGKPLAFFGTEFEPMDEPARDDVALDEATPAHAWGSQVSRIPKPARFDATQTHYPPKLGPSHPRPVEARQSVAPSISQPIPTPSGRHNPLDTKQAVSAESVKTRLRMRYAMILVLTLCAYRGWLYLLERF